MPFKILLVTPPYHTGIIEVTGKWPPLNLVYLAGQLRKNGFEVKIYDAMSLGHTIEDVKDRIKLECPDMVMIGSFTPSINSAIEVLQKVKEIDSLCTTCLGGVHATFCYEDIFQQHSEAVDFIVRGEGEFTAVELAGAVREGRKPHEVPGVVFTDSGRIVVNQDRELIHDLDSLEPAWDLLDWELYKFSVTGRRLALVGLSRGCPHECKFCSQHLFWQSTYRSRTPENFVYEIEMLNRDYGVGMFMMADEFTTYSRDNWEKVLDLLIAKDLDIHISMETRADAIVRDRDILHKYRQAGIIHVYVGVETVHQQALDKLDKGSTVEMSKLAIKLLKEQDIITECSFILGDVDETEERIDRTLNVSLEFDPDLAHYLLLTPWPYSRLYSEVAEHIIEHDYAKYHFVHPIIRPLNIDIPLLWAKLINCFKVFYLNKTRQLLMMEDGFRKTYMMKSIRIMHEQFFVDNFGRKAITLPKAMGDMIDQMLAEITGGEKKMINEVDLEKISGELDKDIVNFINLGLDNDDEARFNELALREFRLQYEANPIYREYCDKQELTPYNVKTWNEIPAIPTSAFKQHVITSFALKDAEVALLTSGTTDPNMRGKIYRDKSSLNVILLANRVITKTLLFPDVDKMRILLLVPSPKVAPAMAMAFGLEQLKNQFGTEDSQYFITPNGFETDELIKALRASEKSGEPVTLVGATSGFVHFFNSCQQAGLKFMLPAGSRICDGGGYQGTFGDCSREEFYAKCQEFLGVSPYFCINTLGMSESGTNYFDNVIANHLAGRDSGERFKVGLPWTRTIVVGQRTGQRLPKGEIGLIRHYDLTNRATVFAVQTDNIGYETDKGFEIIGRAQGNLLGYGLEPSSVKDWILAGHSNSHGNPCSTVADGMMKAHGNPCSTVADGMMKAHSNPCSTVADAMMKAHGNPCSTVADGMMKAHGNPCSTVADGMIKKVL